MSNYSYMNGMKSAEKMQCKKSPPPPAHQFLIKKAIHQNRLGVGGSRSRTIGAGCMWWYTLLVPTLGRQKKADPQD